MLPEFKRFLLKICLLSALVITIGLLASSKGILNLSAFFIIAPALFFLSMSTLMCFLLIKASKKGGSEFIRTFMASQAIKMFIHLIIMTIVAFGYPLFAIHFIIQYALIYLVFTIVELITLIPLASKNTEQQASGQS
jgi:hypothetical protein